MRRWIAAAALVACAPAGEATTGGATGSGGAGTTGSGGAGTGEAGTGGEVTTTTTGPTTTAGGETTAVSSDSSSGDGSTTGDVTTGEGSGSTTGEPAAPTLLATLITDMNRAYPEMHGGWGHHLRGLMRADDDALWFVVDVGEDVLHNRSLRYFRRGAGEPLWTMVAEQLQTGGVQQNAGSVLLAGMILTYGVDVQGHFLEECYLKVDEPTYRACNAVTIGGVVYQAPANSNYVGAAVLGDGARIVWFTVVGENGGPGQLVYTYNYGGGWNGPVVAGLAGANDLGYVHAMATADGRIELVGQTFTGAYPNGTYAAVVADITPGQVPTFLTLESPEPAAKVRSSGDLWLDPVSGAVHALATFDGAAAYYHRPGGEGWAAHLQPLHVFSDTYRARFVRPEGGPLWLVRGSASGQGSRLIRAPDGDVAGAIAWADGPEYVADPPLAGFGTPAGIYVESATYQRAPVGALNFALCGQYQLGDLKILQLTQE